MTAPAPEMVERVKAALSPLVNEDMEPVMRDAWLTDLARAAIEALREPSRAMLSEGCDTLNNEVSWRGKTDECAYPCHIAPIWRQMLDAALTDGE